MNKIVKKHFYSENVVGLVVEAPLIARSRKAGHFVIIRVDDHSERVPLTIADADIENGTITLIAQRVGVSTRKLAELNEGESLADVVGPLGKATDIRKFGTVICACGGVGAAPMLPIARALKQAGNKVITVTAARNKDLLLLKDQLREVSDELVVMTDDGSEGTKGLVTNGIETIIQREKVDKCITIGPAIMMKFVALLTKKYNIPTDASLNTIMVDGTGMCGACRVTVGGKTKFVCVDGPEFDAHEVDFDEMLKRLTTYRTEEKEAMDAYMAKENQNKEAEKNSENPTTELKAKDRVAIPRVKMPELEPQERRHLLRAEVNQGLALEQAMTEAKRCLNCAKPTCVEGCPVNINIPAFVKQIEKGNIQKAADIIHESSS
ncbi:MAG: sulfide/dihydroorotate dehydrogenase-like FAD/NAD-binding protein, partial [Paludibacteraceae bacterium]|nr:sulfide/dihydroorotate dehydrogenase-like FAD/NAD-binding protein [Paludibacteraceae bacterium]